MVVVVMFSFFFHVGNMEKNFSGLIIFLR